MADQRITKRMVDGLEPRAAEYTTWDRDLVGFGVRVRPIGSKAYVVAYRAGRGRGAPYRRQTIGPTTRLSPDQARQEAERILAGATLGADPAAELAAAKAALVEEAKAPKIRDLLDRFVVEHVDVRLLGTPTYDVQGLSDPAIAQAREAKLERDRIDQRKAELDAQAAEHREHIARLDGVDAAGGPGALFGRGTREAERARARQAIVGIEAQKGAIDAAVEARDKALADLQDAQASKQVVDGLRFRQRNAGAGIAPVGAWGLRGAAGLDQSGPVYSATPQGPMRVPLPPPRPPSLTPTPTLKDIKDILGGGSTELNPTIMPKIEVSGAEAAKEKIGEVKAVGEDLSNLTISVPVSVPGAGTAIAQLEQIIALSRQANASVASVNAASPRL